MAWTAATSQTLVEAARQAIIKAELEIEQYLSNVNNPGRLPQADAALAAAVTAINALRA